MKALLGPVLLTLAFAATAETVVPVESVETFVNIRLNPKAGTEIVGRLHRGDELEFVHTVDGWHEVQLPGGGVGYIHADWATVMADEPEPTKEAVAEAAAEIAAAAEVEAVVKSAPEVGVSIVEDVAIGAAASVGQRGPAGLAHQPETDRLCAQDPGGEPGRPVDAGLRS